MASKPTQRPTINLGDFLETKAIEKGATLTPKSKISIEKFDRNRYYTFGEGDEMTQYKGRTTIQKASSANVAFGQLKCFMGVLMFLNNYYDPDTDKDADVLYIGAAVGTNIAVLAKMFPQIEFHLYDPMKFNNRVLNEANKYNKEKHGKENIFIHSQMFEDPDEKEWGERAQSRAVFLVSDIRNVKYDSTLYDKVTESGKKAIIQNEERVWTDMKLQEKWVKNIKPKSAFLKFRMPYYFDFVEQLEYEYIAGTIYRQCWQRPTSSETRFVPDSPDANGVYPVRKYHIRSYENLCYHHNMLTRQRKIFANPFADGDKIKENDPIATLIGLENDFDSAFTTAIIMDYLTKFGVEKITLDGFTRLAKYIFRGVGDGLYWKYNLYGVRTPGPRNIKFRYEEKGEKWLNQVSSEPEVDKEQLPDGE